MSTVSLVIIGIIFFLYFAILFIYSLAWKENVNPALKTDPADIFISVIVPVRNEEENIGELLSNLNNQSYKKNHFEVIIVDDHSQDNTAKMVHLYIKKNTGLNIVFTSLGESTSKKMAVASGVQMAKGELIVTTDADCRLQSCWLEELASYFMQYGPEMIVAPVALQGTASFLDRFQQYDYLALQMSGLASVRLELPLLCSGANLAFKKASFFAVNGYNGNEQIASGDDVFLFLKMHKQFPGGVHALISSKVIVYTKPLSSVKEFLQQRIRWGRKVKFYKNFYITIVGVIMLLVNFILLFLSFSIPFNDMLLPVVAGCFITKTVIDFLFIKKSAAFFSVKLNFWAVILMEIIYPFYYLWLILNGLSGKYEWKGRKMSA